VQEQSGAVPIAKVVQTGQVLVPYGSVVDHAFVTDHFRVEMVLVGVEEAMEAGHTKFPQMVVRAELLEVAVEESGREEGLCGAVFKNAQEDLVWKVVGKVHFFKVLVFECERELRYNCYSVGKEIVIVLGEVGSMCKEIYRC